LALKVTHKQLSIWKGGKLSIDSYAGSTDCLWFSNDPDLLDIVLQFLNRITIFPKFGEAIFDSWQFSGKMKLWIKGALIQKLGFIKASKFVD
jgi:hypothetical protein